MDSGPNQHIETIRSREQVSRILALAAVQHSRGDPEVFKVLSALATAVPPLLPESGITARVFSDTVQDLVEGVTLLDSLNPTITRFGELQRSLSRQLSALAQNGHADAAFRASVERMIIQARDSAEGAQRKTREMLEQVFQMCVPILAGAVGTDPEWRRACHALLPDSMTVEGIEFARAPRRQMQNPEVAAPYLTQVDAMCEWIVNRLSDLGERVDPSVLHQPPLFASKRIEPTGAIGIAFFSFEPSIQVITPFGSFAASGLVDTSACAALIEEATEKFGLLRVDIRRDENLATMYWAIPDRLFVASRDAEGDSLSLTFRLLPEASQDECHLMVAAWESAKPAMRRSEGEAHLLPPALLESSSAKHEALVHRDLGSEDVTTRVSAFRELSRAGRVFLPALLAAFAREEDSSAKHEMFHLLVQYKGILMQYPLFAQTVAPWLERELPERQVSIQNLCFEDLDRATRAHNVLSALRAVGPIAPDHMVPLLIRALDLYQDPLCVLELFTLYGAAAAPAVNRLTDFLTLKHPNGWLSHYAAKILIRLENLSD